MGRQEIRAPAPTAQGSGLDWAMAGAEGREAAGAAAEALASSREKQARGQEPGGNRDSRHHLGGMRSPERPEKLVEVGREETGARWFAETARVKSGKGRAPKRRDHSGPCVAEFQRLLNSRVL